MTKIRKIDVQKRAPADRRPAAPKFRRRAEARPDEILDAALGVFTEKGFDATRVDDIAARAGLSKGAVYLYFDSKDALLRGLIEREIAPTALRLRSLALSGGADPKTAITLLVTMATQLLDDPHIFATPKLVLSTAPRFPEIAEFYRKRVVDETLAALIALYEKGAKDGVFRKVDGDTAARLILGPIFLNALRCHVLGAKSMTPAPERAAAHLEILFKGLSL